jgi:hypothetical protein
VNLADLYRAQGRDDEGERLLREALERLPASAEDAEIFLVTDNIESPNFAAPNRFVLPFRAMLGVKLFF